MPKISVALCTYNGEQYLAEQLKSIALQTRLPDELIICDDKSSDETVRIAQKFRAEYPDIPVDIYVNEKNLHFTGNFLKASSLCSGDYIAYCDQDDIWEPEKLERALKVAEETGKDLIIHQANIVDMHGNRTSEPPRPPMSIDLETASFLEAHMNYILGCCFIVKKSVVNKLLASWDWDEGECFRRKFGFLIGHDVILFSICFSNKSVACIREPLISYRIHENNVTALNIVSMSRIEKMLAYLSKISIDPERYRAPARKWSAEVAFLKIVEENYSPRGLVDLRSLLAAKSEAWGNRGNLTDIELPWKQRFRAWKTNCSRGYYTRNAIGLGLDRRSMLKDLAYLMITPRLFRSSRGVNG